MKYLASSNGLKGVISQKMEHFITTAVRTPILHFYDVFASLCKDIIPAVNLHRNWL
jgi:hypothetical protein